MITVCIVYDRAVFYSQAEWESTVRELIYKQQSNIHQFTYVLNHLEMKTSSKTELIVYIHSLGTLEHFMALRSLINCAFLLVTIQPSNLKGARNVGEIQVWWLWHSG